MDKPSPLVLVRRKDQIYLPKAFCDRVGLRLVPHPKKCSVGYCAYYVDIPANYPTERAKRIARQMKMLSPKLKLGHVRHRLLVISGSRSSPWERSRANRELPTWVRLRG